MQTLYMLALSCWLPLSTWINSSKTKHTCRLCVCRNPDHTKSLHCQNCTMEWNHFSLASQVTYRTAARLQTSVVCYGHSWMHASLVLCIRHTVGSGYQAHFVIYRTSLIRRMLSSWQITRHKRIALIKRTVRTSMDDYWRRLSIANRAANTLIILENWTTYVVICLLRIVCSRLRSPPPRSPKILIICNTCRRGVIGSACLYARRSIFLR